MKGSKSRTQFDKVRLVKGFSLSDAALIEKEIVRLKVKHAKQMS